MISALIIKDLKRKLGNPIGFLLLMAIPLVFTFIMGAVFSPSDETATLPKIDLLIEDHDDSFLSQLFTGSFQHGELANMFAPKFIGQDSGKILMDAGKASALIIIPEGFQDSLSNNKSCTVELIKNPSQAFLPKIAYETTSILCEGTDKLFRFAGPEFNAIQSMLDTDHWPELSELSDLYLKFKDTIEKVDDYLFPLLIELDKETVKAHDTEEKETGNTIFAYILTGIAVMGIFFVLEALGRDFFREREQYTLFRIASSPVGMHRYLLSKLLFLFIAGCIAYFIVWSIGVLLFGIRILLSDLPGFIIISILLLASLSGVVAFLFSIAKSRAAGSQINPAVIIFFSMLGGGMVPLRALPDFIQKIAVISPVYWGVEGLQKIILDHQSFSHFQLNIWVLLGLTILFNSIAFIGFNKKI